ncbi:MAG: GNAT family N-acetyltransferase [Defluviitaleaceae bacterium]|nr:GNAT family N-acetyltransferase [Defluviitaleaceae bacterium]
MIELKKITLTSDEMKECIDLNIPPERKDHAYSTAIILALDYDYNSKGEPMESYAIYAEGKMVGLISYNYYAKPPIFKETCYRIRPFMVDKSHLGNGYEAEALQKLLEKIRTKPNGEATAIFATYDPEENDMAKLYESAGFTKTDMGWEDENPDNNDIIARMSL